MAFETSPGPPGRGAFGSGSTDPRGVL